MVVIFTVLPPALEAGALLAPAAGAVVAGALEDELPELAHADKASATAASPAAPSIFRIRILLFTVLMVSHGDHVPASRSVHVRFTYSASGALRELEPGGQPGGPRGELGQALGVQVVPDGQVQPPQLLADGQLLGVYRIAVGAGTGTTVRSASLSVVRYPETRFTILSPSHGILNEWGHAGAGPPPRWPACA
jgi:hypothetical protein